MLDALYDGRADVRVGDERLAADDLAGAAGAVAARVGGARRVAVVATPTLSTVVAVTGALAAGCTVVPLNPQAGGAERGHVLSDASPDVVLEPGDVDLDARGSLPPRPVPNESPALVVYTSGTTGPPKGAVLSRRAVTADLDGLADAWGWTDADLLVHGLPLFHVHGLVLGVLGALRTGSRLHHVGTFTPAAYARARGSLYFGVPTMWSRIAADDTSATELRAARLLVSGSAALPAPVFDRLEQLTGHRLAERYGLTETLIVTAARHDADRRRGCVGPPVRGVELEVRGADGDGMGEVVVRGSTLFSGYLDRPDATAAAMTSDGWFRTGDLGVLDPDGQLRILGRKATDLIKTGGYKVGAGEVEDALLTHPAVAECAVTGEPDDDLGERVVAWVVTRETVTADELAAHVARVLAPHKRPRRVCFVDELPRNPMGKVQKTLLVG